MAVNRKNKKTIYVRRCHKCSKEYLGAKFSERCPDCYVKTVRKYKACPTFVSFRNILKDKEKVKLLRELKF